MIKRLLAALAAAIISSVGTANSFDAGIIDVGDPLRAPLVGMTITTPAQAITNRAALKTAIFGAPGVPTVQTSTFSGWGYGVENWNSGAGLADFYAGKTMRWTHWYGWQMEGNLWARTHFTRFRDSTCLFVLNGGHAQGFFPPSPNVPYYKALIDAMAGDCDVVLSSMPFQGENAFATGYLSPTPTDQHGWIGTVHGATVGNPIKYFLIPAMGTMNVAIDLRAADGLPAYEKIIVAGISGGGWTTTMMAALDPRITHSFAVAGSVPLAYRLPTGEGDWEQYNPGADYFDLYAMSVAEAGRKSYLMVNDLDDCCFKSNAVWPWAPHLIGELSTFPGEFGVLIDTWRATHEISAKLRNAIVELSD